jgi:HlyD family secretion protein
VVAKINLHRKHLVWAACLVIVVLPAALTPMILAEEAARPAASEPSDRAWQAVAPGRVEPASGEIRIAVPVVGNIETILVKANDKVFAGELLIRLDDEEARARLAATEAQVALRKGIRNDQTPSRRASDRRKVEDSVADAEKAVVEAQTAVDAASVAKRRAKGSDETLKTARAALASAQERLRQRQADLRRILGESNTPLPNQAEGQLNISRAELMVALNALEKTMVRAPIDGTILQVNAKTGELASPSATQPLIVLGDLSALRVRAELDERDFGEIKIGQPTVVRAAAFRGREFTGKVSSMAPIVEPGRINARGSRSFTDVNVVEVVVDLDEPGPLAVGMKVDVYFRHDTAQRSQ